MCEICESTRTNVISLDEQRCGGTKIRKRIWEIEGGLHCSIIGTCLTMRDLGQIAAKGAVWFPKKSSDFEIHSAFVHLAGTKNRMSVLMNKALEKKYRRTVEKMRRANTLDALMKQWEDAFENGDIPDAYWGVLSHPLTSEKLSERAFGEVHMMSHALGASRRLDVHKQQQLESECANLQGKLSLIKSVYRKRLKSQDEVISELTSALSELKDVERKLAVAYDQIFEFRRNSGIEQQEKRIRDLEDALALEKSRAELAESHLNTVDRQMEMERENAAYAAERIHSLTEETAALEQELRSAFACAQADSSCSDSVVDNNGQSLCGRRILYVGGRSNLVRHYRTLIERRGGEFLHHDGDNGASLDALRQALANVDAVLCPVDCVSHGACLSVKQACKHMSKKFVPLRSSGLSSLARSIQEIA